MVASLTSGISDAPVALAAEAQGAWRLGSTWHSEEGSPWLPH